MNGAFFALDAESGKAIWTFTVARFPIRSKAAIKDDVVCFESGNMLYGLDRKTGQEK
jgi:outer membrane protein assembly factor BamB